MPVFSYFINFFALLFRVFIHCPCFSVSKYNFCRSHRDRGDICGIKSFLHSAHVFFAFLFISVFCFSLFLIFIFFLITLLHLVLLPPILSFLVLSLPIFSHAFLDFLYHPLQLFKCLTDFRYFLFAHFPTLAMASGLIGTLTFFFLFFSYLPVISILILVLLTPLHLLTSLISTFTLLLLLLIPSTNQLFFRNFSLTLNFSSLLSLKPGYHHRHSSCYYKFLNTLITTLSFILLDPKAVEDWRWYCTSLSFIS